MDNNRQEAIGAEIYSNPARTSAPAPNPNFSFPMLPPTDTLQSSDYPEPEGAGLTGTFHRPRPSNISINPLPPFGFPESNSGRTPPVVGSGEPSPTRPIPIRGGHRRGGSEFIGGDGSAIGPGLMSTSPTKGEGILPSPPTSGRRRGHAHRRSGAISNHDLSSMLKPSSEASGLRVGSAPNSPADPSAHRRFMPSLDHSASQPTLRTQIPIEDPKHEITPTSIPHHSPKHSPRQSIAKSSPSALQSRPRVGFSDTLEFIPRPLSTISSETSSSLSTIRPSHSVTGSITSVISNATSSPPSAKKHQHTADTLREYRLDSPRPRTADSPSSVSPIASPFGRLGTPPSRPSSAGAGKALKKVQYELDRFQTQNELVQDSRNAVLANPPSNSDFSVPLASPQFQADLRRLRGFPESRSNEHAQRPRSSPEAKVAKKHKNVKTWAGSLLSRRPKTKSNEALNSEGNRVADLQEFAPVEDLSLDDINFDEDNTCVIRSPDYDLPSSAKSTNTTSSASNGEHEAEIPGAVLDLDATWDALDDESRRGGSLAGKRRTMHSSGATGGFVGPGMHYHRRAESAPALTPVTEAAGFHGVGRDNTMADVFEEDEEDDGSAKLTKARTHSCRPSGEEGNLMGLGVQIVDSAENSNETLQQPTRRKLPEITPSKERVVESDTGTVKLSASQEFYRSVNLPVDVVDATEEPRFSVVTKSSDGSTITPTFSDPLSSTAPATLPTTLDFAEAGAHHLDTPTTSSSNPSPDVHYISFDAPRLHTAASSLTDRSTWSSARGTDSANAISYSTEDVPSLTSSASTMISGHPQLSPGFPPRPSGERSYSFSAAVPRRTRPVSASKRSSLASLSRLVGSSYGEKSKLSVESFATDSNDKSDKKKRHRISRMMKFWKSKEKLTSPDE